MNFKFISILATLTFLASFVFNDHPFDKVIQSQSDDSVKAKLHVFRTEGIEQPLLFLTNDSTITDTSGRVDIEHIIKTAHSFLGTKHQLSGTTKEGIDCSGLVMMSFRSINVIMPHSSHEQARFGRIVPSLEQLQRGDLVFFIHSYKSEHFITHSGIYLGNQHFIHASASKGVVVTNISEPYWKSKFIFGTRIK
ncbi:MAG TPA: C40 family peptidase [Cytophagales bacterium]|nr:C40 family peptidase [Cytophagales bacterium]